MYHTALLLITGSIRAVAESIGNLLTTANKQVAKRLYVKIEPELCKPFSKSDNINVGLLSTVVPLVYSQASTICRNIDVRVILTNFLQTKLVDSKRPKFDAVFTNSSDDSVINRYVELNFYNKSFDLIKLHNLDCTSKQTSDDSLSDFQVFKTVALGGTFDRLHNGHKVLLSEGALRCTQKLIVGVSEVNMLKRKLLFELIEPVDKRIAAVTDFLSEMDPSISYEVVPITDPFGPTIVEPDIDCLVVTTETKVGGEKVNSERQKKGMSELYMHVCGLVENAHHTVDEEEKLSSSTKRMHDLGTPLNNIQNPPLPDQPYLILLKDYTLSGRTYLADHFKSRGLNVVAVDKICMDIVKQKMTENKVTNKFSADLIFNSEGSIAYDTLVGLCFKNKEFKEWAAQSVFEEAKWELQKVIKSHTEKGTKLLLIEDSTLFAGYDFNTVVQESWSAIIPESEHIQNLKEHFGISDEEARAIVKTLPSNEENIKTSNVVFCNKWSKDATRQQVDKAWNYLKSKL